MGESEREEGDSIEVSVIRAEGHDAEYGGDSDEENGERVRRDGI